jgi:hypothetical protein
VNKQDYLITGQIRTNLKSFLNSNIKIFDITDDLRVLAKKIKGIPFYWGMDSHYNPLGYMMAGTLICTFVQEYYFMDSKDSNQKQCVPNDKEFKVILDLAKEYKNFKPYKKAMAFIHKYGQTLIHHEPNLKY